MKRLYPRRGVGKEGEVWTVHLVVEPLQLVDDVETAVHDERVHVAGFGAEAGDAITTLLGSAEFELEEHVVFGADDTEVVRHCWMRF